MTKKNIQDQPVAWGMKKNGVILDVICPAEHEREEGEYTIPLYTTPQRTWVDLTLGEFLEILCNKRLKDRPELMMLEVEAKLKEKNT
jgi:hypothetical protein